MIALERKLIFVKEIAVPDVWSILGLHVSICITVSYMCSCLTTVALKMCLSGMGLRMGFQIKILVVLVADKHREKCRQQLWQIFTYCLSVGKSSQLFFCSQQDLVFDESQTALTTDFQLKGLWQTLKWRPSRKGNRFSHFQLLGALLQHVSSLSQPALCDPLEVQVSSVSVVLFPDQHLHQSPTAETVILHF